MGSCPIMSCTRVLFAFGSIPYPMSCSNEIVIILKSKCTRICKPTGYRKYARGQSRRGRFLGFRRVTAVFDWTVCTWYMLELSELGFLLDRPLGNCRKSGGLAHDLFFFALSCSDRSHLPAGPSFRYLDWCCWFAWSSTSFDEKNGNSCSQ